jgi:hypothetical protein
MNLFFKSIALAALTLTAWQGSAQDLESYNWGDAKRIEQDKRFAEASQVYIVRKQIVELNYDDKNDRFSRFQMNHYIIQLNDDAALKDRKELELPTVTGGRELIEFKARIIKKDGTVVEFKKADAKEKPVSQRKKGDEEEDEEEATEETEKTDEDKDNEKTYQYFDLSSLQKGDQLEYFMVLKIPGSSLAGIIFNYQSKIPIQQFDFEFNTNKEFTFLFKSYNNAPNVVRDSTNKVRAVYKMTDKMVDGIKKEKFSNYNANVRGFIYKLDGYDLGKKKNFYTFEEFSKNIFNSVYSANKKQLANIKKAMKLSKMKAGKTDAEKILALENYLKTQFLVFNFPGLNELFNIENMYQMKIISPDAAVSIIAKALELNKIEHELVVTCDRFDYRFDKDFASNYYFDNILIYVNGEKKFLDPSAANYRMGIIPSYFTHNHALFISPVTVGGVTAGMGKIKFIDAPDREFSVDEIDVTVSFASNLKSLDIELIRTMTGYFASNFQPDFNKLDAKQRVSYEDALVKFIDKDMDVAKLEFLNIEKADILVKPFIVKAIASSKGLISISDDVITFKIGMLIGEQSNLYDEETRQLPIENGFSRTFKRTLNITLPSGYKAENLDALNKNFEVKNEKGKVAAIFKSTYTLNGNNLSVKIEEWFEDIQLPASKYPEFRAVINASADFAKTEIKLKKN